MYSIEKFKEVIRNDNLTIVLDNCSILDLYRYPPNISESLLKVYNSVENKIWLPNQVYNEFNKNQETVYSQQFNQFESLSKEISNKVKSIESSINKSFFKAKKFYYPQVNQLEIILNEKINELIDDTNSYTENTLLNKGEREKYQKRNEPKVFVDRLVHNEQVSEGFTKFEKIKLFSEGEIRYRLKYPPGYMDEKEKDKSDHTRTEKYGDLVIWKEILKKAKDEQNAILFVTSDIKEDWWKLDSEKNIENMHPFLIEEFTEFTGLPKSDLLMLSTGTFFTLMVQTMEMQSAAEMLENLESVYSINSEIKAKEILNNNQIYDTLDDNLRVTTSFIHDGELQNYISDIISDVEILEIVDHNILDTLFFRNDKYFIIETLLNVFYDVSVMLPSIPETNLSDEYRVKTSCKIEISIPIKDIESVSEENTQPIVRSLEEEQLLDLDNIEFGYSELNIINCMPQEYYDSYDYEYEENICSVCNKNEGIYPTVNGNRVCRICSYHLTLCPDCGIYYPEGSFIGAFCDDREQNGDH